MYNLTNRLTSAYGMRPDDEFMVQIAPGTGAMPSGDPVATPCAV